MGVARTSANYIRSSTVYQLHVVLVSTLLGDEHHAGRPLECSNLRIHVPLSRLGLAAVFCSLPCGSVSAAATKRGGRRRTRTSLSLAPRACKGQAKLFFQHGIPLVSLHHRDSREIDPALQ